MGILDDAIRQHLELKRRLGADDDELKQLEDEAFGPPTRPGEPDFPEADIDGDGGGVPEAGEAQAEAEIAEAPDDPAEEPVAEDATADHALEDEPSDEEPVVTEHAVLAPEAVEGDDEEAQEAGGLFDRLPDQELDLSDLDLDLDLEDEDDEEDEMPPPAAAAPAIETVETEEHALEDEDVEDEDVEEEPSAEPEDQAGDDDDEDVLADTPEFLRDAPEDDELWFEQGKPKDFDFDD